MITVGDPKVFAISFCINSMVYSNVHKLWVYGNFLLYIDGREYGDILDEVTLEHCAGWIEGLLVEQLSEDSYLRKRSSRKLKDITLETIVELVDGRLLDNLPDDLPDSILENYHNVYNDIYTCANITNIGMSSFDADDVLLLLIDQSADIKRFVVLRNEDDSAKAYEHFVPTSVVVSVVKNFLERYEVEKKEYEKRYGIEPVRYF